VEVDEEEEHEDEEEHDDEPAPKKRKKPAAKGKAAKDDGKKKRKKKPAKDKDHPKGALSAYLLFSNAKREQVKTDNPGAASKCKNSVIAFDLCQ
jgi:structure-specific recognition protein 1